MPEHSQRLRPSHSNGRVNIASSTVEMHSASENPMSRQRHIGTTESLNDQGVAFLLVGAVSAYLLLISMQLRAQCSSYANLLARFFGLRSIKLRLRNPSSGDFEEIPVPAVLTSTMITPVDKGTETPYGFWARSCSPLSHEWTIELITTHFLFRSFCAQHS